MSLFLTIKKNCFRNGKKLLLGLTKNKTKNEKNYFIILLLSLFIYSCGASKKQFNKTMNNAYIGMTIMEFNKFATIKELISMKGGVAVYLLKQYNWYDHDGADGTLANYRYFYFEDNKLIQMDKGERATDFRIKIDK